MTRILLCLSACYLSIVTTGCKTTGDPTQGGLWGWSEEKAVVIQEEKRSQYQTVEQEKAELTAQKKALQTRLQAKQALLKTVEEKLRKLNKKQTDLNLAGEELAKAQATHREATKVRDELRIEVSDLHKQLGNLSTLSGTQ